jgi:hypothetical protein
MEPLFFHLLSIAVKLLKTTRTPQSKQSNRINNVEHTIPLVIKPKLTYIKNQNNFVPEQRQRNTTMHLYFPVNDSMNKGT